MAEFSVSSARNMAALFLFGKGKTGHVHWDDWMAAKYCRFALHAFRIIHT